MALTSTLLELRTAVAERGGYRRSTSLTPAILNGFVNSGIKEVHAIIVKKNPDFIVKRTSPDLVTVAGTETVALPADFLKLRSHPLLISGTDKLKILPFDLDEESFIDQDHLFGWSAVRFRYMLQGANLRLLPAPDAIETIRLWYLPVPTKLVADGDLYDGPASADDLVIEHALARAARRDRRPDSDHKEEIVRLTKLVEFAVEARNQSEPEYLVDLGRGIPILDWGF